MGWISLAWVLISILACIRVQERPSTPRIVTSVLCVYETAQVLCLAALA